MADQLDKPTSSTNINSPTPPIKPMPDNQVIPPANQEKPLQASDPNLPKTETPPIMPSTNPPSPFPPTQTPSTPPPGNPPQITNQSDISDPPKPTAFGSNTPPVPPKVPVVGFTPASGNKPTRPGGLKNLLIIILLLLVLVGAGFGVIWWYLNRTSGTAQEVTLNYWGLWEPEEAIRPVLDSFTAENPNIKINYINSSPQDYRQRLMNQLSSETPTVDIFRFHNTWVPMLKDLLEPVPEFVYTEQEFKQTFYLIAQKDLKRGVSYVGVPLMFDGLGLYYNEDLFNTAGVQTPTDWVSFRQAAKELTVIDSDKNIKVAGAALGTIANVDHWPDIVATMMMQAGADPATPTTQEAQDALTFYGLFAKTDRVWDDTLPNSTIAFATGKVAMYFGPSWEAYRIQQLAEKNNIKLRFKILPIPQLPDTNVTWATYWAEGVSAKSTPVAKSAAWKLLKYLSQKENMEKLYQLQTQSHGFGEPFSRVDMVDQLKDHPQLGAYVLQAPAARSWYLSSDTTDEGGLNARIIKQYEAIMSEVAAKGKPQASLKNANEGISRVLTEYGLK